MNVIDRLREMLHISITCNSRPGRLSFAVHDANEVMDYWRKGFSLDNEILLTTFAINSFSTGPQNASFWIQTNDTRQKKMF